MDTVGVKNICPLVRGVRFFKSWARLALFSRIYYFYTYIWGIIIIIMNILQGINISV